uniref:Histone-lysine N-methyltransferase ASHH2 n=1 Tax=Davidia involucrata TaxID=16924 RepID=A0A5B6ZFR2_DAVIN
MLTEISPIEENVCNVKEGSSDMDPNCAVENLSVSLQSCEPFCAADNDSPKSFVAPDIVGTNLLVGAFNSISIVESSGRREHEGKDNVGYDDASKTMCPDIIYPSSRRSTRMNKLNQKTQAKKDAGKRGKTAKKKPLLDLILLRVARRRRSFLCKQARSSVWGLFGNVTQVFEQNIGLDVNQNEYKESRKVRSGRGSGKQNKNQAGRSSQGSKGKIRASTSGIRLKLKLGKEVNQSCPVDMVPVVDNGLGKYRGTSIEFPKLNNHIEDKLEEQVPGIREFQYCNGNMEKGMMLSDASILDVHLADKDLDSTVIEKLAGNTTDNNHAIPCQIEDEGLGVAVDNKYLDPGTSPDSEVINLIPDAQVSGKVPEDLHDALISSQACVAPQDVMSLSLPQMSSKKGMKKDKLTQAVNCSVEDRFPNPEIINKARELEKPGQREKMGDGFYSSEASISTTTGIASGNTSSSEGFSREPLLLSGVTDFGVSSETLKDERSAEVDLYSRLGVGIESPESRISEKLLPSSKSKGRKLPKNSKSTGVSKSRPVPDSTRSRRGKACRQKGNQTKSVNKRKIKEKGDFKQVVCKVESHAQTGNHTSDDHGETKTGDRSTTEGVFNLDMVPSGIGEQCPPPRSAWVRCDDCYKWRRIPAILADSIDETNCKWICKDNMDKAFADCSIPQEKSNAEINVELEISDASCEEDACDARLNSKRLEQKRLTVPQQSSWTLIKSNLFLHRSRKTQTIDEVMVCHCKPPLDGQMGCRDGCLNRMLNIECVQGTCPCGEFCSNQQFHKHNYAKLRWFRCGKKGYGLQLLEDISRGQFLIEYVGEVLHMHAYEARQREYASKGHKHFYFMTLNGSEVIDACAKGNLGRFINHSCDPNCRTEKWMVNGEVCIGLFALRDIKKGEEVTFDYNYVRIFGAAAKKCVCGSSQCRGYIGGDPLNTEVIVQGDSDEEYPEPVMLYKDGEIDENLRNLISASGSLDGNEMQIAENMQKRKIEIDKPATPVAHLGAATEMQTAELLLKHKDEIDNSTTAVGHLEIATENEDSMNESVSAASKFPSSLEMEGSMGKLLSSVQPVETSLQPDDLMSKTMATVRQECSLADETMDKSLHSLQRSETTSPATINKSLSDTIDTKRKSKSDAVEDRRAFSKSRPLMRTSRSSSVKGGKSSSNSANVNKPQVMANKSHLLPYKPKKLLEGSSNDRFEAVQEKLNELLDADGGISKRKDAPKGYLKLLLLTAASGDSGNGEAIQSNRDLSMILDALLKTKSRMVLFDIINKNGLQMLHNIMKRYRRDFNKIPILRKLLKVLEYLAVREILTSEHINGGPPCPGVESFRESILTLTEHDDKQVHQIARNFRDRWIPRPVRKISCMDSDDGRMEFHRGSNCNRFLASHNHWRDQSVRPMETIDCVKQSTVATPPVDSGIQEGCSASSSSGCATNGTRTRKRKSRWDQPAETNPPRSPQHKEPKIQPSLLQKSYSSPQPEIAEVVLDHKNGIRKDAREEKNFPGCVHNFSQQVDAGRADEGMQNIDEDVPPGFLPPHNGPLVSSNTSSTSIDHGENVNLAKCPNVVMGYLRERFSSRLSVSYGIPLSVVQQFGTPQADIVEGWVVAPGMPFHPFPPLPPYPREKRDPPTCAANRITTNQPAENVEHDSHDPTTYLPNQETPSTSGSSPPDMGIPGANIQHDFQLVRGSSFSLGGRYFRQQKWSNSKLGPPWIRKRNGWGSMGNNSRSGMCSIGVGSVANEFKGSYNSAHVGTRVESACNTFYQPPHDQD